MGTHQQLPLLLMLCLCWSAAWSQYTSSSVNAERSPEHTFNLFTLGQTAASTKGIVSKATYLKLDKVKLKKLMQVRPKDLRLEFPSATEGTITIDLFPNNILTEDFYVDNERGERTDYQGGLYYRGEVVGHKGSLAAISIFDDMLMGVFTINGETYVLGHLNQNQYPIGKEYILYKESDLLIENTSSCGADALPIIDKNLFDTSAAAEKNQDCKIVKVYFEADNRLYQDKGSTESGASNYVTGLFNVVALLYENEDVYTQISQIRVWTSPDNYPSNSSLSALTEFRTRLGGNFNGDIAHLLSTVTNNNGGVAYVGVLCVKSYAVAYSNIRTTFSDFPSFSWTIEVVTHEMGHNLGSPHTHSCDWPGGAIDNCFQPEGGCARGSAPVNGGTIMSYCHLTNSGINFQNGFGPLPGDLIRAKVASASCLSTQTGDCGGGGGDDDDDGDDDDGGDNDDGGGFDDPNLTRGADDLNADGLNISANVIVRNNGNGLAESSEVGFYLSLDNSITTDDYFVASSAVGGLGVGDVQPVELEIDLCTVNVPNGTYYLGYIIDYTDSVSESNEFDNVWYWINPRFTISTDVCDDGGDDDDGGDNDDGGDGGDDDDGGDNDDGGDGGDDDDGGDGGGGDGSYCGSEGGDATYEWIAQVSLVNIDNQTNRDNGYGNYTNLSTDLNRGSSPDITLAPGYKGEAYDEMWAVWIDFNQDGDFDDSNELVFQNGPTNEAISGTISIPGDAPTGSTRMRVSMKWYEEDEQTQGACSNFGYGEVEDYMVNITGDVVDDCTISSIVAGDQSECNYMSLTFDQDMRLSYNGNPDVIMINIGGASYTFAATGSPQQITVDGLPADGNDVDVTVMLESDGGCSDTRMFRGVFTAPEPCPPTCDVPIVLGVEDVDSGSVTISWEAATFANYYQVRYRESGDTEWIIITASSSTETIDRLTENSTYEYQIRSNCDDIGWSDWSEIYYFVTDGNCGIPSPRTVDISNPLEIGLDWYAVPGAMAYRIRYREYNTTNWIEKTILNPRVTLTDITPGVIYEYQLRAKCNDDFAGWSPIFMFVVAGNLPGIGLTDDDPNTTTTEMSLSPNPSTTGWVRIATNVDATRLVHITDLSGKLLKQVYLYDANAELDISDLNRGLYFVTLISQDGQRITKRLVKQ